MIIPQQVIRASEKRATVKGTRPAAMPIAGSERMASAGAPALKLEPAPAPRVSNAELSQRRANLSFAGARPSPTEFERTIGTNDLVDEFYLERALAAAKPVCRVIVRNEASREVGYATGFLVSPRLLLTNWHVFRTAEEANNGIAEFDYTLDVSGNPVASTRFLTKPDQFYYSNEELDFALVAVSNVSLDRGTQLSAYGYHSLVPTTGKINEGEWITIIQYPGGQRRQYAIRENQLLEKQANFLWYKTDTAPGSSGAPAFNDSFQVVGLHHCGQAKRDGDKYVLKDGSRVDSLDRVNDSDVVWESNEGVRVSVMCDHIANHLNQNDPYMQELRSSMQDGGIIAQVISKKIPVNGHEALTTRDQGTTFADRSGLVLPLQIQVSLAYGQAQAAAAIPAAAVTTRPGESLAGVEKLTEPIVDPDYSNRHGYEEDFLGQGLVVSVPELKDESMAATMEDGKFIIPYEHFSVAIHKQRRLALFTASNVDGSAKARRPEAGDFSRKGLTGLGPNDQEKWVTDPRIPEQHQIPDVFYTKDGGAFDKGHIVRREDVCWGKTRDQIVRANGDTFHTTNCSPQVAGFNRSNLQGLWGELENYIAQQVKNDKFCLIAGPVLSDQDEVFVGRSERGELRLRVPRKFWKIVAASDNGNLQAFAFVLEQSLQNVQLEPERFAVSETWIPHMTSVQKLEDELGTLKFNGRLKTADQFKTTHGDELLKATEMKRVAA